MTRMNFQEAQNTPMDDINRPPNPPQGTYIFTVTKQPVFGQAAGGRYDTCDFLAKAIQTTDDVDADELKDYGDVTNINMRYRFMFNTEDSTMFDRSMFNLKRFIYEHLGVEQVKGKLLKQAMAEAPNHQFLGTVEWRADPNDPEIIYAEIKRTAPVE